MGARTARKLCLDQEDKDVRCVLRELSRVREWLTSGSSESESPSDDDDTVVQRHFEDTSTFGHHMKPRCASADAQTRCLQGGLDTRQPVP